MRSASSALAGALLSVLCCSAFAQVSRTFPMHVTRFDATAGEIDLAPRLSQLAALADLERARFEDALLPDGSAVEIDARRLDLSRLAPGIRVDGQPAPRALAGLDLSVWFGTVVGDDGSEVALSFSRFGSRGWVRTRGETFHLLALPGEKGGWDQSVSRFVSDAALARGGRTPVSLCRSDALATDAPQPPRASVPSSNLALTTTLYECRVSVETDYELHQVFGNNLSAETSYVASLLTWGSYRYEEQIGTVLTYPYVQFYTTPADPWTSQDTGGNCLDLIYEFQAAWQNNVPAGGDLGHFLSGENLGCGAGWIPGVCSSPNNFSVSGNINGQLSFPVQPSPANLDFYVLCHEIGHNFNSLHTHEYCPPLDQCPPAGYFGPCQTQQVCTNQGTLMSYCHACPGGFANITTYFHPATAAVMRAWVESSCLSTYCADPNTYCVGKVNSVGCVGAISHTGHPTLSGIDDFHVRATNVLNNKSGLLFWGFGPASVPFQGGTRCVATPTKRTPPQISGGNPPPNDCSGVYDFFWSHAFMNAKGLTGGSTIYAQYWTRDAGVPSGTGLSDAIQFTICE